jgi:hypothetical protein
MLKTLRRACRPGLPAAMFLIIALPGLSRAQSSDKEPNDTLAQALLMVLPVNSFYGEINPSQDIDFYKFAGQAGSEIVIWAHATSELEPMLAFYDSSGKVLAYNDKEVNLSRGGPAVDPILYIKIPTTGVYYVSVCSRARFKNLSEGATSGSYSLWVFPHAFWVFGMDGHEPNDTRAMAAPISLPFDSNNADLTYLGDVDWFSFRGKAGEKVSIDIEALEAQSHPDWPMTVVPRLGLFDEGGHLLGEAAAGADPEDGFPDDPVLIFDLPHDGRYFIGVTAAQDSHYASILGNAAFLADPYASSANGLIGHYRLRVGLLSDLYFPQIANGAFGSVYFATSVILINPNSTEVSGSISFFKSDGTPMEVSKSAPGGASSTVWFHIPPKADFVFKSNGTGLGISGYARVRGTGTVGGNAIFSEYTEGGVLITEAAVGVATPMDFFSFPVDVTGDFNTGVAVVNPGSARDINIVLDLVDLSGRLVATQSVTLAAGRQMAVYVSGIGQLFPGLRNFRGSLQVMADVPVPAVALRISDRTMTTLPAVALDQSFQPTTIYFPQVVVGPASASYRSTIILVNSGYFAVSGTIRFTRSDGSPMEIGLGSAPGGSTCTFDIRPQGTLFLESLPTELLMTGYAVLTANHGLGGVLIFSQFDAAAKLLTEAAVPPAQPSEDFLVFAQSDGGYNTGVALANVNELASGLSFLLRPDSESGTLLESTPSPLEAGRHNASLISGANQLFPVFSGTGTLEVRSAFPIPAVALRLTGTTMTAVPVVPVAK